MRWERVYASDFETTTEKNLATDGCVRVWLWSIVSLDETEAYWGTNIQSWWDKLVELKATVVWFHNLRFDGSFVLDWALRAGIPCDPLIDGMGSWYSVDLEYTSARKTRHIELRDSLKKFPGQSVASIARMHAYPDKHEKPNFDRYWPLEYEPTAEEVEYCLQDSRIVAHAMQLQYQAGHKALTLAGDAFRDVQKSLGGWGWFKNIFPRLDRLVDAFCRESYKGGYVYCNPIFQGKTLQGVRVFDVNSLYPYVMYTCALPYGPVVEVDHIPRNPAYGYIVKVRCSFRLRKGFLPTIQLKHDVRFDGTEYLSRGDDVYLTLTGVDYEMFHKHYHVEDEQFIGCYMFRLKVGLMKPYIDYWTNVKIECKKNGDKAGYYLAKRYLNSPYGKFGTRPDKDNKKPYLDEHGDVRFHVEEELGDGVYIPYASYVCACARRITITAAQTHYDQFVYADTDSIHLIGEWPSELDVDPVRLGAWDNEEVCPYAKYLRPKTYIHADENLEVTNIKCAGLPESARTDIGWDDFQLGAVFDGKTLQKRVKGGVIITKTTFEIKGEPEDVKAIEV